MFNNLQLFDCGFMIEFKKSKASELLWFFGDRSGKSGCLGAAYHPSNNRLGSICVIPWGVTT